MSALSPEGIRSIASQLCAGVLFDSQLYRNEPNHPLLLALKKGFDYPLAATSSIGPMFSGVCTHDQKYICNLLMSSVAVFWRFYEYVPHS